MRIHKETFEKKSLPVIARRMRAVIISLFYSHSFVNWYVKYFTLYKVRYPALCGGAGPLFYFDGTVRSAIYSETFG